MYLFPHDHANMYTRTFTQGWLSESGGGRSKTHLFRIRGGSGRKPASRSLPSAGETQKPGARRAGLGRPSGETEAPLRYPEALTYSRVPPPVCLYGRAPDIMATDQPPPPAVLLIVDPDGWLHQVPRRIFKDWCEERCIDRPDNLLRACTNFEKTGWHFSNETGDKRGSWQPLHKLVFLRKVDKQLNPIATCARACRPDPCRHEPGFMACRETPPG